MRLRESSGFRHGNAPRLVGCIAGMCYDLTLPPAPCRMVGRAISVTAADVRTLRRKRLTTVANRSWVALCLQSSGGSAALVVRDLPAGPTAEFGTGGDGLAGIAPGVDALLGPPRAPARSTQPTGRTRGKAPAVPRTGSVAVGVVRIDEWARGTFPGPRPLVDPGTPFTCAKPLRRTPPPRGGREGQQSPVLHNGSTRCGRRTSTDTSGGDDQ